MCTFSDFDIILFLRIFGSVHLFLFLIYTSVLSDLSVIKEKVSAVDEPCAGVSSVGGRPNRPNHSRPIHGRPNRPNYGWSIHGRLIHDRPLHHNTHSVLTTMH